LLIEWILSINKLSLKELFLCFHLRFRKSRWKPLSILIDEFKDYEKWGQRSSIHFRIFYNWNEFVKQPKM